MRPRHLLLFGVTASAVLCFPSAAATQGTLEFTPLVGLYIPTGKVIDQFDAGCSCQLTVKQHTNFMFGARVGVWPGDRLGLEGSFGYSASSVSQTAAGFGSFRDTTASIVLASGRVLVGLGPRALKTSFYLSGGIGLVSHGGAAYSSTSGKTRVGAAVGLGARFRIPAALRIRAELEDYLYSFHFSHSTGAQTSAKFQNDLVLSLGLGVPVGGR